MEKVVSSIVSGKWKNELGSVMEMKEKENGQIIGTYLTAVTSKESSHTEETADLVGYINTDQTKQTTTIAFCMAWKIEGSCSAFTGQIFQENKDGSIEDVIKTTWILHSPVDGLQDNWEATCVGENTFHRCP
ncbi:avidin-like [Sinocyclocheilus grahami]|uniref:Avidin-like n=1 Tax=Sinocyclocheilus grahami TaxID=75366 RepID=A0A672K8B7_SINGR|nr:PREDICTED: avidin-like [Sinocyclocheilus grahami]